MRRVDVLIGPLLATRCRQICRYAATAFTLVLPLVARAGTGELPSVLVEAPFPSDLSLELDADSLAFGRVTDSDAAVLVPGADVQRGGAVSGLPSLRGLGDDRLRTLVDGVPISSACPMHMNPPLSYVDPSRVQNVTVLPGVTPVSLGGDSVGGTIAVKSASPEFAADGVGVVRTGMLSSIYRSNGDAESLSAAASVAGSHVNLNYQGSALRSGDYDDGHDERIRASRVKDSNQQFGIAVRGDAQWLEVRVGYQDMPYQGFPNADMDLFDNVATFFNVRYTGAFDWARVQVAAYLDRIRHQMNGNAPDRYPASPVDITSMGFMPTRERGEDFGYRVELEFDSSATDTFRVGSEFHGQTLDDRWPGAPVGMMFDYLNLNHATRDQLGTFVEWQKNLDGRWNVLAGVRNDRVWMNTGPVQGYDGVDTTASAFNSARRSATDRNVDATLMARFQPDSGQSYDLGFARKSRSPNLYERYAWGQNTIGMVSWFGDGNGYTGSPDLKPETAYTFSAAGVWQDPSAMRWRISATPYFTRVQNYIGVDLLCGPECSGSPAAQLAFANHDARLYGFDASASYRLLSGGRSGNFRLVASAGLVRGEDLTAHTGLYRMMPLNGTLGVEHGLGGWQSRLEIHAVTAKLEIDPVRLEPKTGGYAITTLRTAYVWRRLRLDAAITNLFDRQYADPLGGRWQSGLYHPGFSGAIPALPGMGRSFDVGLTLSLR